MEQESSELIRLASPVASIDVGARLCEAAREMAQRHVGSLVVTEGGEAVGLTTDRDVALASLRRPRGSSPPALSSVISRPLITIPSNASLDDATEAFAARSVRRLGLVNRDGELMGVLSADVVLMEVGRLLGDLSGGIDREFQRERTPVPQTSSVFGSE